MNALIALAAGLIFGLGLMVSGMSDPGKVLGFLDVAGHWDPSLAFVMAGAIPVAFAGFRMAARRPATPLGQPVHLPQARAVDTRLVLGSALFGAMTIAQAYVFGYITSTVIAPAIERGEAGTAALASAVLLVLGVAALKVLGILARRLLRLFLELHRLGTSVVIATHDFTLMDQVDARRLVLGDGHLHIDD